MPPTLTSTIQSLRLMRLRTFPGIVFETTGGDFDEDAFLGGDLDEAPAASAAAPAPEPVTPPPAASPAPVATPTTPETALPPGAGHEVGAAFAAERQRWQSEAEAAQRQADFWRQQAEAARKPAQPPAAPAPQADPAPDPEQDFEGYLAWRERQAIAPIQEQNQQLARQVQTFQIERSYDRAAARYADGAKGPTWAEAFAVVEKMAAASPGLRGDILRAQDPGEKVMEVYRNLGLRPQPATPDDVEARIAQARAEAKAEAIRDLQASQTNNPHNLAPPSITAAPGHGGADRPARVRPGSKEEDELLGQE